MKISDKAYGFLLSFPGLLLLAILFAYPLFQLVHLSFLRYDNVNPITFTGLSNYMTIINDRVFRESIIRTIIYMLGVSLVTMTVSVILAHSLNRVTKGSGILRTLAIMPWAVPLAISGMFWLWLLDPVYGFLPRVFQDLGLGVIDILGRKDTAMIGVILADAWTKIPMVMVILLAGLQAIPQELYASAKIDGADSISIFWHISLPLNKRQFFFALFLTMLFSSRTIDVIIAMTGGGPAKGTYTLGYYYWDYLFDDMNFGIAAASGVMLMILCICIAWVLGRLFARKE